MPIELSTPIAIISQDEFHAIDRAMMRHAFDIHNQFGRLLDEAIYKTELTDRCLAQGFTVQREVLIRVRHQGFSKDYFIDLLLNGSTIIEAKTARVLTEANRGQGLNYLLLAGTHHGSLVNFRPTRVKREFLSTTLTHEERTLFTTTGTRWPADDDHTRLRDQTINFAADVGLGLDIHLYREGITTLIGHANRHLVPVLSGSKQVGHHEMHLLREDVGLTITALTDLADCRMHLQRLLAITSLASIAWVNLNLHSIHFGHLTRQNHGG